MAFVKADLGSDTKEPEAAPEGEYDLRILSATRKESKSGNMMTEVMIRIEDTEYPNTPPIYHYLIDTNADTPAQQKAMRALELKRFLTVFGIKYEDGGYDDEDLAGATGRSMVMQEEGDDKVIRNRLRLPRLRG